MFRFPSRIAIAQSVSSACIRSFNNREGYVVALEGESGSGRSTTLEMIAEEVSANSKGVHILRLTFSGGKLIILSSDSQTLLHQFLVGLKWSTTLSEPLAAPLGPAIATLASTIQGWGE